jgi:Fungal specific transcription factor domain
LSRILLITSGDEDKPTCGQCNKSSRDCVYAQDQRSSPRVSPSEDEPSAPQTEAVSVRSHQSGNGLLKLSELLENATPGPSPSDIGSPLTTTASFTSGNAPHHWYDLIAEDAVKNIDNYNFLTNSGARWSFEPRLSTRPSEQPNPPIDATVLLHSPKSSIPLRASQSGVQIGSAGTEPSYNTEEPPVLREYELRYLQHYLEVVAPILDLFDPQQHFTTHVLHLALRNVGLLKSVLALSALYKARCSNWGDGMPPDDWNNPGTVTGQPMPDKDMATQYYYETLNYLSQAMLYHGYPHSQEILANAALISWYEALETEASTNWERHLKGVFWIQRSQNTNGEAEGLRRAVW